MSDEPLASLEKKAQPAEEHPQDLDEEIVHLRRALAECEVARNRLEMSEGDLMRDLRIAKAALDLGERRVSDLESTSESLIVAMKAKADETEEARHEAEKARSALGERHRRVEDLLEEFAVAGDRIAELESALSLKERLGGL